MTVLDVLYRPGVTVKVNAEAVVSPHGLALLDQRRVIEWARFVTVDRVTLSDLGARVLAAAVAVHIAALPDD